MPTFDFQGQPIDFQLRGTGAPLLLIHGFCEDQRIWDEWSLPFQKDYEVLTFDLPGFGQSPLQRAFTISDMAMAVEALLEEVGWEAVTVVGHSMGGYVALAWATLTNRKINALGLFHSHPFADSPEKQAARDKGIEFVKENGVAKYTGPLVRGLFSAGNRMRYRETIDLLVERAAQYSEAGIINALEAMRDREDRATVLQEAQFPIWFLIGEEDEAVPAAYSRLQTALPSKAQIDWLQEVGHMGQYTARAETQQRFRQFLQRWG
jgi:pimeloyl-ACP methyl ester carboxylesterase